MRRTHRLSLREYMKKEHEKIGSGGEGEGRESEREREKERERECWKKMRESHRSCAKD